MKTFNSSFNEIEEMELELIFEMMAVKNKIEENDQEPKDNIKYIDEVL
ncbi:MAG: hypothetical protein IJ728_14365 [Selenomonadaceae bacterium]|nr:hypothetical protein [Selenomonadaceae bacterium]